MKKRLFVAAEIPKTLVSDFSRYQATLSINDVTWTTEENFHLTVAFLGYVDDSNIHNIEKELALISAKTTAFDLHYDNVVLAPPGKDATMIWAKLAPSEQFSNLVSEVYFNAKPYITEQVRTERIPHITLARFRQGVTTSEENLIQPQLQQKFFKIDSISLFESKPSNRGSEYEKISSFKLAS